MSLNYLMWSSGSDNLLSGPFACFCQTLHFMAIIMIGFFCGEYLYKASRNFICFIPSAGRLGFAVHFLQNSLYRVFYLSFTASYGLG